MPQKTVCPKTGALIYSRTPEEQKLADMEKELRELRSTVTNLTKKTKK